MAPTDRSTSGNSARSEGAGIAVRLPRRPSAPGDARSLVRMSLGGVMAEDLLEDVLVVISELVTNAVLYGEGEIALSLSYDERCVTGEVADEGAGFGGETQRPRDPARIGGNGLFMVGRIADRWGQRDGAANVWFEIAVPGAR